MNPRKKMLHALRDLAQQLHEQKQEHEQRKKNEEEGRKQSEASASAATAITSTDTVEEGVPSNRVDIAAERERDRQMQELQAENARLRQKVQTMRQLLGVDTKLADSQPNANPAQD